MPSLFAVVLCLDLAIYLSRSVWNSFTELTSGERVREREREGEGEREKERERERERERESERGSRCHQLTRLEDSLRAQMFSCQKFLSENMQAGRLQTSLHTSFHLSNCKIILLCDYLSSGEGCELSPHLESRSAPTWQHKWSLMSFPRLEWSPLVGLVQSAGVTTWIWISKHKVPQMVWFCLFHSNFFLLTSGCSIRSMCLSGAITLLKIFIMILHPTTHVKKVVLGTGAKRPTVWFVRCVFSAHQAAAGVPPWKTGPYTQCQKPEPKCNWAQTDMEVHSPLNIHFSGWLRPTQKEEKMIPVSSGSCGSSVEQKCQSWLVESTRIFTNKFYLHSSLQFDLSFSFTQNLTSFPFAVNICRILQNWFLCSTPNYPFALTNHGSWIREKRIIIATIDWHTCKYHSSDSKIRVANIKEIDFVSSKIWVNENTGLLVQQLKLWPRKHRMLCVNLWCAAAILLHPFFG